MPTRVKCGKKAKKEKQVKDVDYGVERIVGRRTNGDKKEYEIKWLNYTDADNTWEPEDDLKKTVPGWLADYIRAENAKDEIQKMIADNQATQNNRAAGLNLERRKRAKPDDSGSANGKKFKSKQLDSPQRSNKLHDFESDKPRDSGNVSDNALLGDSGTATADVKKLFKRPIADEKTFAKENTDLKILVEEKDKEIQDLKARLLSIQDKEKSLEKTISEQTQKLEDAQNTYKHHMDAFNKKHSELNILLEEKDNQLQDLRARLLSIQEKEKSFEKDLNEKTQKLEDARKIFQEEQKTSKHHMDAFNKKYCELKFLEEKDKEVQDLKARLLSIQGNEKSFKKNLIEKTQKLEDAQKILQEEQKNSKHHMDAFNKKCEDFDKLQENFLENCEKFRLLQRDFLEKSDALNALEGELQKKSEDYTILQNSLAEVTIEHIGLKCQNELELTTWKGKLNTLQKLMTEQQKRYDDREGEAKEKIWKMGLENYEIQKKLDRWKKCCRLISQKYKKIKISLCSMNKLQDERDRFKEMCTEMIKKFQLVLQARQIQLWGPNWSPRNNCNY